MKYLGFLFLLTTGASTYAHSESLAPVTLNYYSIVSDEFSADVPQGKCLIVGQVIAPPHDTVPSRPLQGGLISSYDQKLQTRTDEHGMYRLLVGEKDSVIFFFYSGLQEVVISPYDFKSRHVVTINFRPWSRYATMVVDKPVIYLSSPEELTVSVAFSCIGDLTFSYPEYNGEWNVTVNGNTITDRVSGRSYPYLFWESETDDLGLTVENGTIPGFLLNTDTAVVFLENVLGQLGLSVTEQTDFITYWAPKMIRHPYCFVQFLVDDDYASAISAMTITPTPDAMRRVFMKMMPLDQSGLSFPVQPQAFTSFERTGFTVVEWGGSEIMPVQLNP